MSLRDLPSINASRLPEICAFAPDGAVLDTWNGGLKAADTDAATISILDLIGEDYWSGGGVTAKRIDAALRSIGERDVFVDINSPGGDFFDGVAIYNLLRAHPHKVTVRIVGVAASAASVIAMAGDDILIGAAGFLMVHNAWVVAVGNRHDLASAAETLRPFDEAMAGVYAARSGVDLGTAQTWMDGETWFNGKDAIASGLADSYLASDLIVEDEVAARAAADLKPVQKVEYGLAKAGLARSERRNAIGDLLQSRAAVAHGRRPAVAGDQELAAGLQALRDTLKS